MEFPTDRKYSKVQTWISIQDNTGTIGITEFAQSELGEIIYADLPNVGYRFQQDEVLALLKQLKRSVIYLCLYQVKSSKRTNYF